MRKIRSLIAVLLASSGMLLGAFATQLSADAMPVITHPAMLTTPNSASRVGTSATWSASNWSGYAETGSFTSISGSWTVPTVTAGASTTSRGGFFGRQSSTSAWYSATWLGVDGFNNSNLIQTGTEQDYYNGSAHYSAWWEILPAAETGVANTVYPGDVMTATITETPTQVVVGGGGRFGRSRGTTENDWVIALADTTPGHAWTFSITEPYAGSGSSAEWIVEAPDVNGQIASLAKYNFANAPTSGDFNGAEVATTIGGTLAVAGLNYANDAGTMVQNNAQVSTPGPQDTPLTGFNANYGSIEPLAPTS